jgi:hypothetical protein
VLFVADMAWALDGMLDGIDGWSDALLDFVSR